MDIDKVDQLIRFIVLAAGQSDEYRDRSLGPIHIIKYLYLADLAYAERNKGKTFTGICWKFHHFGPWSVDAYQRLEPALINTGAQKTVFESQYDDKDCVRWSWPEDRMFEEIEKEQPFSISAALRRAIGEFGSDTYPLLRHVYRTEPMIHAAPEEELDFSFAMSDQETKIDASTSSDGDSQKLSIKKMKARKEHLESIRTEIQAKFAEKHNRTQMIEPTPSPRYDDVFAQGQVWLDEIAGGTVPESSGELIFDDSVWKHTSRTESDVP